MLTIDCGQMDGDLLPFLLSQSGVEVIHRKCQEENLRTQ